MCICIYIFSNIYAAFIQSVAAVVPSCCASNFAQFRKQWLSRIAQTSRHSLLTTFL